MGLHYAGWAADETPCASHAVFCLPPPSPATPPWGGVFAGWTWISGVGIAMMTVDDATAAAAAAGTRRPSCMLRRR